jgi:hypothetical protein|tara:strand:+ start:266 stop:556 length:291 start_codon:yes stop_codon:yes gene_type:complete
MVFHKNNLRKFLTLSKKSVKLYTDDVLTSFYDAIRTNSVERLHIPHSDVFYVRAAVEAKYGKRFSLKHVETIMKEEGWTETDGQESSSDINRCRHG